MFICYLYPFNAFLFILCPFSNCISALLLSYESLYLIANISLAWVFIIIKELCRMKFFCFDEAQFICFTLMESENSFPRLTFQRFSLFYFLKVFIIIFSHFNSFAFPYDFWNKLPYIDRKSWILIEIGLNLCIGLGRIDVLTGLSLLFHKHGIHLH